ncbi:MAG: tautomerase family protein [Spirochaetales bacterium]|nr:tautomerase family protein [Spirochaetales bacterium]MBP5705648.1 tautomerase family protein [Spirochaetales bacterium]
MPYIAIKAYPKDEEIKKRVADRINQIFLEEWGCKQEAISLSIEEIQPEKWTDEIRNGEIESKKDKMMILDGQKKYK